MDALGFLLNIIYFTGVFISRGREDALVTKNIIPGETVYGEKKISVDVCFASIHYYIFLVMLYIFCSVA